MAEKVEEVMFFQKRREVQIGDFNTYKEGANIRMLSVPCRIPMANRPNDGVPEWILDGYEIVVKDDSKYGSMTAKKKQKIEGVSVTFFTTDTIKSKMNAGKGISGLNGCAFSKMHVDRVGEADKTEIYFHFTLAVPCNHEILLWFYDMQGSSTYMEFDSTQAEFQYDGAKKDGDKVADDENQEQFAFGEGKPKDDVKGPKLVDPNDDPTKPIPGDKRQAIKPTDKPSARSAHGKNKTAAKRGKPTVN